jgi:hypothetical protein
MYFEYRGAFQTTGYVLSALQAARAALEDQVFFQGNKFLS